jgi:hypothetical protein
MQKLALACMGVMLVVALVAGLAYAIATLPAVQAGAKALAALRLPAKP